MSSGSDTSFDKEIDFNLTAEIGFLYNFRALTIRAGILFMIPTRHDDIKGTNSSGTELFNLETDISVIAPSLFIESDLYKSATFRAFLVGGAGFGIVDVKNVYTMTAAGTTAFAVGDYEEKFDEETLMGSASLGIEYLFADTVTMLWEFGYRYMVSDDFKHKRDADTIIGSVSRGQNVVNSDGAIRSIDFSGMYASVGFRFYIDILN